MLSARVEAALTGPLSLTAVEEIARQVWRALAEGHLSDAEAERLAERAEARRAEIRDRAARAARDGMGPGAGRGAPVQASLALGDAVRRARRPPERTARLERRRMVAACGALPPEVARYFTPGQIAVLSVVARRAATGGPGRAWCDWPMMRIADLAGVRRTTVRDALRLAERLGLVRVRQRRRSRTRSDTNLVSITAKRWWAWLRRGPRRAAALAVEKARTAGSGPAGDGCETSTPSSTEEQNHGPKAPVASLGRVPGAVDVGTAAKKMGARPLPPDLQASVDHFLRKSGRR